MAKSKILITGGSGLLGSNAARMASGSFDVYATYITHLSQVPGCQFVHLDVRDKQQVVSVFERIKPDLVIHAAGLATVDYCEEHEDEARAINVDGTENVTVASKRVEAKLIYISTDSVFDGQKGMYTEEYIPQPLSVYAKTKLEGEKIVQRWMPDSIIARTAFYGWSLHDKPSLGEWVLNGLRDGKKLKMWNDVFFSPILVNNLVEILIAMHHKNLSGIYHVGGKERCSKYAFGQEVARAFGLNENNVEPSNTSGTILKAPRPKDASLNVDKVSKALVAGPLGVKDGIARFKELESLGIRSGGVKDVLFSGERRTFIPYGHQWIDDGDIDAVVEVLKGDWITQGPEVDEFEKKVAAYCGAKYAVAVSNGTAALHAACAVAGIAEGDEVITTPITFAATANAIVYCGGKPVFADINKDTINIDTREIRKRLSAKTKAIIPVDFAGHPADLDEIKAMAKERGLTVIEDAAHALGAEYKGRRIGSLADMTVLSFHPVKHITTGEGGMILTGSKEFYDKLKIFRNHGIVRDSQQEAPWFYEIHDLGHNFRITDFQCALGLSQMSKLDRFVEKRRQIAKRYNEAFSGMAEIITPMEKENVRAVYHIYVIQLSLEKFKVGRKEIFKALRAENIGVNVHYIPVHFHPYYQREFGYKKGDYPRAEKYYERAITLPIFPKMGEQDIQEVIAAVRTVISRFSLT